MPELPEVETMRRGIAAVAGCRIRDVTRPPSKLKTILIKPRLDIFRRKVVGRRVTSVRRIGKRVILELAAERRTGKSRSRASQNDPTSSDAIVIEPRMSGLVLSSDPPDHEHLRLVFHLQGCRRKQILFWDQRGLGAIRLLTSHELAQQLGPQTIGPDALVISCQELQERLSTTRRPIKVAFLDQRLLAGIGNIYASEILHRAGIHPAAPSNCLAADAWPKLHQAMQTVLHTAIRHQGTTLGDGTYRTTGRQTGRFQYHLRVYGRVGELCRSCSRANVLRIVQAQRSTYFCPICQSWP